jgi:hypothetical protein
VNACKKHEGPSIKVGTIVYMPAASVLMSIVAFVASRGLTSAREPSGRVIDHSHRTGPAW